MNIFEAKNILKKCGYNLLKERNTPEENYELEQQYYAAQAWKREREREYRETGCYLEDIEFDEFVDEILYKLIDAGYADMTEKQVRKYIDRFCNFNGTVDDAVELIEDYIAEDAEDASL